MTRSRRRLGALALCVLVTTTLGGVVLRHPGQWPALEVLFALVLVSGVVLLQRSRAWLIDRRPSHRAFIAGALVFAITTLVVCGWIGRVSPAGEPKSLSGGSDSWLVLQAFRGVW